MRKKIIPILAAALLAALSLCEVASYTETPTVSCGQVLAASHGKTVTKKKKMIPVR